MKRLAILVTGLAMTLAVGATSSASPKRHAPGHLPAVPPQQPPTVEHFASATLALERILVPSVRVVAFGEYHQTQSTKSIRSSLSRFVDELLPTVARYASDLVVETWVADGKCGQSESKVVEDVKTATLRPPETENQIVSLLRRAQAAGMSPHILAMSCKDYRRVTTRSGATDFVQMLTLTRERLQADVARWLARPSIKPDRPAATAVAVYGGALHNDLYPTPADRPYAFGRALFAESRGDYLEIDLFVPEYIRADKLMATRPWFGLFEAHIQAGDTLLIRRSERSYVLIFPLTADGRGR
jgi:hypothetical protein